MSESSTLSPFSPTIEDSKERPMGRQITVHVHFRVSVRSFHRGKSMTEFTHSRIGKSLVAENQRTAQVLGQLLQIRALHTKDLFYFPNSTFHPDSYGSLHSLISIIPVGMAHGSMQMALPARLHSAKRAVWES